MGIDYWAICHAVPARTAKALVADLGPEQICGAIVGPDEEAFAPAWVGEGALDVTAMAARYAGGLPHRRYWEGASVELPEEWFAATGGATVMTDRSSALAGLDRVLAIPAGVELMRGQALARIPRGRVAALRVALDRLWSRFGGTARAAAVLQPFLHGNANEGAAKDVIELVERGVAKAIAGGLDLLLLSATPP